MGWPERDVKRLNGDKTPEQSRRAPFLKPSNFLQPLMLNHMAAIALKRPTLLFPMCRE